MKQNQSKIAWSNDEAKAALARYEALVRGMARRLCPLAAAGRGLDLEDLQAEGRVAVLDALSSFESYGVAESSWVRVRVRQRMIDAIRRLDPRSRGEMRLLSQERTGALDEAETEACRAIQARRVVSMEPGDAPSAACEARIADPESVSPDEAAHANRQHDRLRALIVALPVPARVTIELRLFEGASLAEVGERLGVSAARVCQIQTAAVERLSSAFATAA